MNEGNGEHKLADRHINIMNAAVAWSSLALAAASPCFFVLRFAFSIIHGSDSGASYPGKTVWQLLQAQNEYNNINIMEITLQT